MKLKLRACSSIRINKGLLKVSLCKTSIFPSMTQISRSKEDTDIFRSKQLMKREDQMNRRSNYVTRHQKTEW
jgi:hypothetical protein